jgi:signal transduction histidine kinase
MLETAELVEPHLTLARRIDSSAKRMQKMIGDLLDFTRSRLGGGIPIEPATMSMEKVVHDVVEEICAAHPGRKISINARGGLNGAWDSARISQALSNLIGNAVENSVEGSVVSVDVKDTPDETTIVVHNTGVPIPTEELNGIFGPMKSRETAQKKGGAGRYGNLGLGLFIAERIVSAHQGTIDVRSDIGTGTTFTIHLPRPRRA